MIFNGSVKIFKTGFKRTKRIVRAKPPIRYEIKPPDTFIPEIAWEIKKIEKELNKTFLTNDFIY